MKLRLTIFLLLSFMVFGLNNGYSFDKTLNVPLTADNRREKTEFAYMAQQKLVDRFNFKGQQVKKGIITREEMQIWEDNFYRDRMDAITRVILDNRQRMKESVRYAFDIDTGFTNG